MARNRPVFIAPPITKEELAIRREKFIVGNPSDPNLAAKRKKDWRKIVWHSQQQTTNKGSK